MPPPQLPKVEETPPAAPAAQHTPTFGLPVSQQANPPVMPTPPVDDLPSLPPPPPVPQVKMDAPDTKSVPADAPSETNHHALLDPLQRATGTGAPFSADTTQGSAGAGINVDPVNNGAANGHSEFSMHTKVISPPPAHQTPLDQLLAAQSAGGLPVPPPPASATPLPNNPVANPQDGLTPDSARQAVENAYASAPFNPALNPTAAVGAQPVVELHQPPAEQEATPSLNLPGSPQTPPAPPQSAPPPMPPPIMPDPNAPMNTPYGPMPPPSLG
jgi:hypothetical protein